MLEVIFSDKSPKDNQVKVVTMYEGEEAVVDFLSEDEAEILERAIFQTNFEGKFKQFVDVYGGNSKIILVGLGKEKTDLSLQEVGIELFDKLFNDEDAYIVSEDDNTAINLAYGILQGSYSFDKYKTEKKAEEYTKLEKIELMVAEPDKTTENFKPFLAMVNAIRYCKDLCNEPANYLTPEVFAADIKRLEYLGLDVEIYDADDISLKGFGLIEAVGKGSVNSPKVVVISWKGNRADSSYDLGLVGKGVCFDAGGLSLKSNAGMVEMKMDMAGAAAVVAVMKSVALQCVRKNLVAIVGLVENMSGSAAMKIGVIYASYAGKTVEIMNADAEGRLIVADCLAYLQKNYKLKKIIDITTLGALKNVLGNVYAGVFGNDDKLIKDLIIAGDRCGEKLWMMPLDKKYDAMLKSKVADMRNIASDGKASVVSAAFLSGFVEKEQKWSHIDMSGMRLDKTGLASGFGVKLLNELIKGL